MSNNEVLKFKTIKGFFWRFLERCGAQGVNFVVSVILARLLEPNLYGTIALVTVFTAILQVFVDSGLANALIQKKDADKVDFSSVFYLNMAVCSVLYIGMFIAAPHIARYYNDSTLTPVIRVMSLVLIISGLKNVQQAYVSRNMMFKKFFFSTLGGTIFSAILGVGMAYLGYGVWALVAQNLSNMAIDTLVLWFTVKWRPNLVFSLNRIKELMSYGWKILASSLVDTVYNNIRQLIIGKMYSASDLAYYNRGKQIPSAFILNINTSIDSVIFPAMSLKQEDKETLKNMTRRSIRISSYIIWPLMMGVTFAAEPIIKLLLTEKWIEAVPYLRIFCITYAFTPIMTANLNAIKAMGRSDINLILEVIKKILGVVLLVSSMWFGVMAIAYSLLLSTAISLFINSEPNKKLLNYGINEQLKDIMPPALLSVFMGLIIYPFNYLKISSFIIVALQVVCGAIFYVAFSRILKLESFEYIINTISQRK